MSASAPGAAAAADIEPVLSFLRCRTPARWVEAAVADLDTLLLDHASLELKAAEQAQKLIRRYGARRPSAGGPRDALRRRLVNRMSRLAREELRHFEQVVALIEARGARYEAVSPARYAAALHALVRRREPGALGDSLVVGAVIEARSCERFFSLIEVPGRLDPRVASFYSTLLAAEARHFENYLALAKGVGDPGIDGRIDLFLDRDAELVQSADDTLRFLSGVPGPGR